jgi:hypothetical protein
MKSLITITLVSLFLVSNGQSTEIKGKGFTPAFNLALQSYLGISSEKAQTVLNTITQSNSQMDAIVINKTLSKIDKLNQFKIVASQRDGQLASLLSPDQIKQLTYFMISKREEAMKKKN